MLRRRAWIILAVAALTLSGTYYLIRNEEQQYEAEALVRVRDRAATLAPNVLGTEAPPARAPSVASLTVDPFVSAILELRGRALAAEVVEREGLRLIDPVRGSPSPLVSDVTVTLPAGARQRVHLVFARDAVSGRMGANSLQAPYGAPLVLDGLSFTVRTRPAVPEADLVVVPTDSAIDRLLAGLQAERRPGTDVVGVTFTSRDREVAVRVVNAVVEQYQARSTRSARAEAVARRVFIENASKQAAGDYLAAQAALQEFRAREQVYRTEEKAVAEQTSMIQRELERGEVIDERRVYQALLAEADRRDSAGAASILRSMITAPVVARNPVLGHLVTQLAQYESTRDSLLIAGRPPAHESVRQLATLVATAQSRIVDAVRAHLTALDGRLAGLAERGSRSAAEIRRLSPAGAEELRLTHEVETTRDRADQLRRQKELARINEAAALGNVEIMERATRAQPADGHRFRKLALGLGLGLLVGCALAFLLEHLNTGLHRRAEVEAVLGVPGLAVIPRLPTPPRRFFGGRLPVGPSVGGLVAVAHSQDPAAEAYRGLRTNLLFLRDKRPLRTLVIASATEGEGKTTTAANTAAALAQQGLRVLLVDCDLRRPGLHGLLGLSPAPGLTDLLQNTTSPQESIRATGLAGLDVLPHGTQTSQPAELLGGDRMVAALRQLAGQYDIVVIDTPPVLSASDAVSLAARADGVLFVLRAGRTGRGVAREAMHQLLAVGANVVGAVLNDPDAQVEKYEPYGYGYSYYSYGRSARGDDSRSRRRGKASAVTQQV